MEQVEGPNAPLQLVDLMRLESVLKAVGAPAAFAPPALAHDLDQLETALGRVLPDDLKTLYRWHNGVEGLIPYGRLLTTTEIAAEYAQIEHILGKESQRLRGLVPVIQEDRDFLMVRGGEAGAGPIYRWSYWDREPFARYASLLHLVNVIENAYQSRAYFSEYDGWFQDPFGVRCVEDVFQPGAVARRRAEAVSKRSTAMDRNLPALDRLTAVRELTYEPSAVPTLLGLLDDPDSEIVRYSAFALGKMHVREALPALLAMLDSAPRVAADTLAEILTPGDASVVGRMLPLLTHADPIHRIAALNALRAIRSPEATPAVIAILEDLERGAYWYAIQVLAYTRDRRAVEPLRAFLARVDSLGLDPVHNGGSRGSRPTPELLKSTITQALDHILAA